jgi:two-component system, NtrC family, sensor histidine kinase KinB
MKLRHLQTRFILAGGLLVMTTVVSGLWSAWTFARLSAVAGTTLQASQEMMDLTAVLANALEREDDAYLLAVSGDRQQAAHSLVVQRNRFANAYARLLRTISQPDQLKAAAALRQHVDEYRAAGDAMLAMSGQGKMTAMYQHGVNPALRRAVADCTTIRELNFRALELDGLHARDEARRATILVSAISSVALIISTLVAVMLARSILHPVQELGNALEALRSGDFERRARVAATDELAELAAGFNRMAEALAEFRRSNLGEVLRAKEALEATVAALPDAVFVVEPDGQIVARNPLARAVLRELAAEETNFIDQLPFPAASLAAVHAALHGAASVEARAELERAFSVTLEGHRRKFILTAVPIPEFHAGQFGAVVVLYDVTDFARLDELRMELVGVASHELKTPLTTLRMNLLLLGEDANNLSPRQHEILSTALVGCQELANTIDELLDLTRIEAGQLRLSHEVIDLYGVIDRAILSMRQRYDDAEITLRLDRQCPAAVVRGDPVRLGMVFTNLLSNALKYTPHGGLVRISVASVQNAVGSTTPTLQIAVTDTGPGIPLAFRERVFDKFFRVEQHHDNGGSGTRGAGIGLYLCRQIVDAHGGRISCEPAEDGLGASIALVFPSYRPTA